MKLSPDTIAAVLRRDFDAYVEDGKTEAAQAVEVLAYAFADLLQPVPTFDRERFLTAAIGGIEGDPSNGVMTNDDYTHDDTYAADFFALEARRDAAELRRRK